MNDPIQLDDNTNELLEFIIEVSDSADANPYPALSREDVVAIGIKLFHLACMSELMFKPAAQVYHIAHAHRIATKGGE